MGSSDRLCRLCAKTLLNTDDDKYILHAGGITDLGLKIQRFLGFEDLAPKASFPTKVCKSCSIDLDFCIGFVDRARRVEDHLQNGSSVVFIQADMEVRYPNLAHGADLTTGDVNASFDDAVSFPTGEFFGSITDDFIKDHAGPSLIELQTVKPSKKNFSPFKTPMEIKAEIREENVVVEVEPDVFDTDNAEVTQTKGKKKHAAADKLVLIEDKAKIRKILPREIVEQPKAVFAPSTGGGGGSPTKAINLKDMNQVMIPITLKTPCKRCGVTIVASSVHDINRHVCADSDKKVVCTLPGCAKTFFTQTSMKYHVKHCHKTGLAKKTTSSVMSNDATLAAKTAKAARKFVCPYEGCDKSYNVQSYMTEHQRTHTGERPFSCENCGKGFFRVLDMKKHKLLKVCQ